MSQNIAVYIKKGMVASKKALYNQKQFYIYCLFLLTSLFGKLFFITYPIFALADIRLVKTIEETGNFEVEKTFEDANSIKKVWTMVIFILLKTSLLLSGIVILSGITYWLSYLGEIIDNMTNLDRYYITALFWVLGVAAIILFIIIVNLFSGPAAYIIQTYDDYGISDTLIKSFSIMRKNGKRRLLLINLFHLLRFMINSLICSGLIYIIYQSLSQLVFIFCSISLGIILLLTLPKIILSNKIATISLFSELTADDDSKVLLDSKDSQNIKRKVKKEDLLVTLFDNSIIEGNNNKKNEEL